MYFQEVSLETVYHALAAAKSPQISTRSSVRCEIPRARAKVVRSCWQFGSSQAEAQAL